MFSDFSAEKAPESHLSGLNPSAIISSWHCQITRNLAARYYLMITPVTRKTSVPRLTRTTGCDHNGIRGEKPGFSLDESWQGCPWV